MSSRFGPAYSKTPTPTTVKDLQRFIWFANFYRWFIRGFSSTAAPFTSHILRDNWCRSWRRSWTLITKRENSSILIKQCYPSVIFDSIILTLCINWWLYTFTGLIFSGHLTQRHLLVLWTTQRGRCVSTSRDMERVGSFKSLGVHISKDLKSRVTQWWEQPISVLYFLRKLRRTESVEISWAPHQQ